MLRVLSVVFAIIALTFGKLAAAQVTTTNLADAPAPEVIVQVLEAAEIYEARIFGGFIESNESRPAAPEVAGTVDKFLAKPGDRVKRGEVLFLVKPRGLADEFQHHAVHSPLSGIISTQLLDIGAFVQPGDAVMQVANPDQLTIRFDAALQDALYLKKGMRGHVSIAEPGISPKPAEGIITAVSPASHPELRTYQVYMRLDCSGRCLPPFRLGAFARILIKENPRTGIRVANEFLHNNAKSVYIVTDENIVQEVAIKTGPSDGSFTEITAGLEPGMRLVTTYSGRLRSGEPVTVKEIDDERLRLLQPHVPLGEH